MRWRASRLYCHHGSQPPRPDHAYGCARARHVHSSAAVLRRTTRLRAGHLHAGLCFADAAPGSGHWTAPGAGELACSTPPQVHRSRDSPHASALDLQLRCSPKRSTTNEPVRGKNGRLSPGPLSEGAAAFGAELVSAYEATLPSAIVVDVGRMGTCWAVIEANAAWASGITRQRRSVRWTSFSVCKTRGRGHSPGPIFPRNSTPLATVGRRTGQRLQGPVRSVDLFAGRGRTRMSGPGGGR
ncbi:ATP-grasp domain-containing protein [Streptomyces sp. NPDC091272]|uniref:ATP-grasp domain-containing protein n=1 Tax=Streptomyces sp. NPDC091272 TaxID=3365981 RepID=UPI00382369AB